MNNITFENEKIFEAAVKKSRQSATPAKEADQFFFPGFKQSFIRTRGAVINTLVGGSGTPLLLLHGHPQTHVTWHKVAASLAREYTVVMTDLRGYGDSSKPDGGPNHIHYSKREMGKDQIEVMKSLGFDRFQAVGHDRGGRVLHQMMLDDPDAVDRAVVLDIAPTSLMYAQTDQKFAKKYFWWFFQIQKEPLPENMINATLEYYLKDHLAVQNKTPGAVTPEAFAEYFRCYQNPSCVHAVCEDYRAAATVDAEIENEFQGRKAQTPLLALWGAKGTVGQLFDVLGMWRERVEQVSGGALPCGHLIPEEDPEDFLSELKKFLHR